MRTYMKRGILLAAVSLLLPVVALAATSTAPLPIPSCTMSTPPGNHQPGSPATLVWFTENGKTAAINQGIGQVPLKGTHTVYPTRTTIYTMTVGNGQTTRTCSAMVTIATPSPTQPLPAFNPFQQTVNLLASSVLMRPVSNPYITPLTSGGIYAGNPWNAYGSQTSRSPNSNGYTVTDEYYYDRGSGQNGYTITDEYYYDSRTSPGYGRVFGGDSSVSQTSGTADGTPTWSGFTAQIPGTMTSDYSLNADSPELYNNFLTTPISPFDAFRNSYLDKPYEWPSSAQIQDQQTQGNTVDMWGDCGYWDCSPQTTPSSPQGLYGWDSYINASPYVAPASPSWIGEYDSYTAPNVTSVDSGKSEGQWLAAPLDRPYVNSPYYSDVPDSGRYIAEPEPSFYTMPGTKDMEI